MNPYHSLKKTADFLDVYHHGKHKRNEFLVFFKKENGCAYNRFGVSVSKKVGNSVQRHRMIRLSRAAFRMFDPQDDVKCDYILSWKKYDASLKCDDVLKMIGKLNEKCCHKTH